MEKVSGVYLTITDNSFLNSGTEWVKIVVPILTNNVMFPDVSQYETIRASYSAAKIEGSLI